MLQLKIDKKMCAACALCSTFDEMIEFDDEGYAKVKNDGLLDASDEEKAKQVAGDCPEHAITVSEYKSKSGISSEKELMEFMKQQLTQYKVPEITEEDLKFPLIVNSNDGTDGSWFESELMRHYSYSTYKSERKAMSEGRKHLADLIQGPLKSRMREALSIYKTGALNKYRVFEKEKGNYYYDCISQAEAILSQISTECQNIYGIALPEAILTVKSEAVWYNDCNNKNSALDYLENRLIQEAMDNVENASWYEDWIDVSGYEKSWNYDAMGAYRQIAKHAISGLKFATSYSDVYPIVEQTIQAFNNNITNEMHQKYEDIINFLKENNKL